MNGAWRILLVAAVVAAGCIQGAGAPTYECLDAALPAAGAGPTLSDDEAQVLITRDFGTITLRNATVAVTQGMTVMDALMDVADVETDYGGGFVVAIDGLRSQYPDARLDWFFEVDGRAADVGAAQWTLAGGERIHWDYRPWSQPLTPGLFNTFPWTTAEVRVAAGAEHGVPGELAARARAWDGSWPAGPAVLVTTPDEAPWATLPGDESGGMLAACGRSADAAWSAAARVHPADGVRAVLVGAGLMPPVPGAGTAWVLTEDGPMEVRPA